jgi:NAD(P)-dependent dehydrogenase (short-subunit alcohol dehydrogenase family)
MAVSTPIAIVTGGGRRIGRAIVEDLAAHGWAVAIHCNRSVADAEEAAHAVVSSGGRATVVRADLADIDSLAGIVSTTAARLGPATLLVNSAGVFEFDAVGGFAVDVWRRQMTVNLEAPVFLSEAFAAALPRDRPGNIVNIIDQRVLKPNPHYFSYQLSKSALWVATQTLAQALAPRIRVNAIGPGPTLKSTRQTDDDFARQSAAVLLKRGAGLAEFGQTVRYLVDTPSVTGQMIALDGGQHLAWETPDQIEVQD